VVGTLIALSSTRTNQRTKGPAEGGSNDRDPQAEETITDHKPTRNQLMMLKNWTSPIGKLVLVLRFTRIETNV
jgi:hypothetical protein